MAFKAPATAPVSAGNTGFGFGGGFGAKPAAATSAFGGSSLFGAAKTTAAPTLGTATATTGFGFKQPAATGFGAFGATASTAATTAFPAFGAPATTTAATTGFGTGGFGTTGGFGLAKPTTGFGATAASTGGGLFSNTATQAAPAQTSVFDERTKLLFAVHDPQLPVTDKEKSTIKRWNQLQALWGSGKGCATGNDTVQFKPENPFAYFKAVGYSFMPKSKDEDGLVALIINKPLTNPEQDQKAIMDDLNKLVANMTQLSFIVDSIRALPDNKTELVIYLQEKLPNSTLKRVTASNLHQHMVGIQAQLQTKQVVQCVPKASMSESALQYYLKNPPAGVDRILWEQAKKDNPDPANLLPVPMIGFSEIQKRRQHQQQQCDAHQTRLNLIQNEIKKLQQTHATTLVTLEQHKRRHLGLSHRLLSVIVRQEVMRKKGFTMSESEEGLRNKLDSLQQELNAPTQFKSRLNELLSQMRMQSQSLPGIVLEQSQLDDSMLKEIKEHLDQQQKGLKELINIVKDDVADLGLIETGYVEGANR